MRGPMSLLHASMQLRESKRLRSTNGRLRRTSSCDEVAGSCRVASDECLASDSTHPASITAGDQRSGGTWPVNLAGSSPISRPVRWRAAERRGMTEQPSVSFPMRAMGMGDRLLPRTTSGAASGGSRRATITAAGGMQVASASEQHSGIRSCMYTPCGQWVLTYARPHVPPPVLQCNFENPRGLINERCAAAVIILQQVAGSRRVASERVSLRRCASSGEHHRERSAERWHAADEPGEQQPITRPVRRRATERRGMIERPSVSFPMRAMGMGDRLLPRATSGAASGGSRRATITAAGGMQVASASEAARRHSVGGYKFSRGRVWKADQSNIPHSD
ncbi:hypothetical protein Dimus_023277 [Dionaea muscipula]